MEEEIAMPSHHTKLTRKLDPDKPQSVIVSLNAAQVEIVNRLLVGGLHGNTGADVVRRLFCDGCIPHSKTP